MDWATFWAVLAIGEAGALVALWLVHRKPRRVASQSPTVLDTTHLRRYQRGVTDADRKEMQSRGVDPLWSRRDFARLVGQISGRGGGADPKHPAPAPGGGGGGDGSPSRDPGDDPGDGGG